MNIPFLDKYTVDSVTAPVKSEVSDDTLNDDVMEILKQKWVELAVKDRSNKEDDSFWTEFAQ